MDSTKPQNDQQEDQLRQGYRIRQVTNYQAPWIEQGRGESGRFNIQLILDHGVEEYIVEPNSSDADVLLKLLAQGGHVSFDQQRKIIMFPNRELK